MKKIVLFALVLSSTLSFAQKQSGDPLKAQDFNSSTFNIGAVQQAILNEAQFRSLNGDCWVELKGQNIAGSDYANLTGRTTLPNAQGRFLRNIGGSAVPLGQTQEDAFQGHFHTSYHRDGGGTLGGTNALATASYHGANAWGGTIATVTHTVNEPRQGNHGAVRIDSETRPANLSVSTFIKINKTCNF